VGRRGVAVAMARSVRAGRSGSPELWRAAPVVLPVADSPSPDRIRVMGGGELMAEKPHVTSR